MQITITCDAKETATLVLAAQEQPKENQTTVRTVKMFGKTVYKAICQDRPETAENEAQESSSIDLVVDENGHVFLYGHEIKHVLGYSFKQDGRYEGGVAEIRIDVASAKIDAQSHFMSRAVQKIDRHR